MNETVGVVRERERERRALKNGFTIYDAINLEKVDSFVIIDNKKIYIKNKRIDYLAKARDRVMHKCNICTKLLQNSLSFLRTKSKYIRENINGVKDKYA